MDKFIKEIENDFNLFDNEGAYTQKLEVLSDELGLKGSSRFLYEFLPTYYSGNILATDKIIIIGINPGGSISHLELEQPIKEKNFNSYLNFQTNFFSVYNEIFSKKIKYYSYLAGCFNTQSSLNVRDFNYWEYCSKNLVNIDLIPYHSTSFKIKENNPKLNNIIGGRFDLIFNYLLENKSLVRFIVVHKSFLSKFLLENYLNSSAKIVYSGNNRSIHLGSLDGLNILIFSRFIPNGGFRKDEVKYGIKCIQT